jgi:hypothetical protein
MENDELFPVLEMRAGFCRAINNFIPAQAQQADGQPATDQEEYFRRWNLLVRKHYPEECQDDMNWLKAGLILFLEYGNRILQSEITGTTFRAAVLENMFDRFGIAFQNLEKTAGRAAA